MRSRRAARASLVVALLLASAQAGLLLDTAWDKSDTADETRYLASAASLWSSGTFGDLCEAPVLPKWGFALAMRAVDPQIAYAPRGWQPAMDALLAGRSAAELRRRFLTARSATIVVVVLGGLLLWRSALRFGPRAAAMAHALWCFSPTVLANGSLAALDAWAAALMCAVLWTAIRFRERPSAARVVVLGIACGAAAATKITTLLALPTGFVLLLWSVRAGELPAIDLRRSARLGGLLATALFLTLWALYGFTVGGVDVVRPCPFVVSATSPEVGWLPFPAWLEGLVFQLRHGHEGHPGYLAGETRAGGWWWFYLACLAFKITVACQALVLLRGAASVTLARRGLAWFSRADVALLAYPLALLVFMSAGSHQANISFLLPAFPFAIVWLGQSVNHIERAFGAVGRRGFCLLVVLAALESLSVHPHHLMFFNVWAGGPSGGPRYLVHREDWGQDKRRLAEWQRSNGIDLLYYAPYGPHAEEWGIRFAPVPCTPTVGVYALHAAEVHRTLYALQPGCIDWLTVEPPDERIGYSIYIYRVDESRLRRLAAQRNSATPFWRSGAAPPPRPVE